MAHRLSVSNIFSRITKCSFAQQSSTFASWPKTPLGSLSLVDKVVTTKDNTTFVALHPTREFPYEMSRPLPPPTIPTSYLIRDEAIQTANRAFNKKHPELAREELSRVTHTTVHRWFPRARDTRRKKTPIDREYL